MQLYRSVMLNMYAFCVALLLYFHSLEMKYTIKWKL